MTIQTRGTRIGKRLKHLNALLEAAGKVPEGTLTRAERAVKQLAKSARQAAENPQEQKARKLSKRQKRQAQSEKSKQERDARRQDNERQAALDALPPAGFASFEETKKPDTIRSGW